MNLEVLESKLNMGSFFKSNPVKSWSQVQYQPHIKTKYLQGFFNVYNLLFPMSIVTFCWKLSVGLYFGILADFSSKYCHV